MAMKRCPICGERYSDTYRDCPFCEEEEAYLDGEEIRRNVHRGGRRVAGRQRMSLLTPLLIVLIIIMASLLVYLLWGDSIGGKLKGGEESTTPPSATVAPGTTVTPVKPEKEEGLPTVKPAPETEEPGEEQQPEEKEETPPQSVAQTEYDKVNALPNGLVVSNSDFTLGLLGETHTVRVSGGSGTYTWVSQDEGIASVDSNGKVTAVSNGTVNVLVTDGNKKGVVIVRVKASGSLPEAPAENTGAASSGSHKLNREDITLKVGEKFQLKATGVMSSPTWSSSKTSAVSVNGDGTVTGVAPGTATVTVSWDGGSLSCIVRVK